MRWVIRRVFTAKCDGATMSAFDVLDITCDVFIIFVKVLSGVLLMITAAQLRAARALAGLDQKTLAQKAGVSLPTIQRMEASAGNVRGVVETLTKIVAALDPAGIELISDNMPSQGTGRGVRLKAPKPL